MIHAVIYSDALSLIDEANLRDFNREHNPVTITVVDSSGYSKRYKLREVDAERLVAPIPKEYMIRR